MKEYKEAVAEVEAVRAPFEDKVKAMSVQEILADAGLKSYVESSAKVLFGDNCAACHGADLEGDIGPELTGMGYEDAIIHSLIVGGISMMIFYGYGRGVVRRFLEKKK